MSCSFDERPLNTAVFPVVRPDLVEVALTTFWQFSERDAHRAVVIDQTVDGLPDLTAPDPPLAHLQIRAYRNLGFAKACNLGLLMASTPLVTLCNDDVEFFDAEWWPGLLEVLRKDNFVGAAPCCPKLPGWSVGKKEPEYIAGVDSREKCRGRGVDLGPSRSVHAYLRENTPHRGYIIGPAFWCVAFKRVQLLSEVGLFDERFYPGAGEDYDMLGRIAKRGLKVAGTWNSWVWHDWGRTKDERGYEGVARLRDRPGWNRMGDLWPDGFDAWGRKGDRIAEVRVEPL